MNRNFRFTFSALALSGLVARLPRGDGDDDKDEDDKRSRPSEVLNRFGGDTIRMSEKVAELENSAYKLRRKRDDLQRENDDLKKNAFPDGAVVLLESEVAEWNAYRALGKPDDVKKRAEDAEKERDTFKADKDRVESENAQMKADVLMRDVAAVAGYKPSVLADRAKASGAELSFEVKDVTADGKTVKRAFVKFKDGEGENAPVKEQALDEYAQAHWADYLPALQLDGQQQTEGGVRLARQNGGGGGETGTIYDRIRKDAEQDHKKAETPAKPLEERLSMR